MKRLSFFLLGCILLLATGCHRECKCWTYEGTAVFYSSEELKELDMPCQGMENWNYGLRYSVCEWN